MISFIIGKVVMVVEEEEKKNTYMRHFSVSCLKQEMEHQSV